MPKKFKAKFRDLDVTMPNCDKSIVASVNSDNIFFQETGVKDGHIDRCCVNEEARLLIFHVYNNGKIDISGCGGCSYFGGKEK